MRWTGCFRETKLLPSCSNPEVTWTQSASPFSPLPEFEEGRSRDLSSPGIGFSPSITSSGKTGICRHQSNEVSVNDVLPLTLRLKKRLTGIYIVRDACYRQLSRRTSIAPVMLIKLLQGERGPSLAATRTCNRFFPLAAIVNVIGKVTVDELTKGRPV
jgi:hypothetical protein